MTPRDVVAGLLAQHLPVDVDVLPYARAMDPPTRSTVMVRLDKVVPSPAAGGARDYDFALVAVAAKTLAGPADDELDALLEDVLHALEQQDIPNGVVFKQAERAVFEASQNPCYEIQLTVTFQKES